MAARKMTRQKEDLLIPPLLILEPHHFCFFLPLPFLQQPFTRFNIFFMPYRYENLRETTEDLISLSKDLRKEAEALLERAKELCGKISDRDHASTTE
jgi:hypothetical protein